jgi:hypothetical protein
MPNKFARVIAAILLCLGSSPLLAGETWPGGRFSITPWVGALQSARLGSLVPLPQTADVPGINILWEPDGPEGGLLLGYRLTRRLEIQVGASAGRTALIDDIGIGLAGIPLGKKKVSNAASRTLGMRLLYGFGDGLVQPYLAAGFGIAALDAGEFGSRTRPTLDFGAGLKFRPVEHFQAVLDVRDMVSFFRYFEDLRIIYPMIYTTKTEGVQQRLSVRLGLGYIF